MTCCFRLLLSWVRLRAQVLWAEKAGLSVIPYGAVGIRDAPTALTAVGVPGRCRVSLVCGEKEGGNRFYASG